MLEVQVIYFSDTNRAEIVGLCKSWTLNWTGLWTEIWTKIWTDAQLHVDYFLLRIITYLRVTIING